MKKIIVIFLLVFISCKNTEAIPAGNTFYFENPQPINDSELKSFPNNFLGLYMSSDSTYLNFQKDIIIDEYRYKGKIDLLLIDSLKLEFDFLEDMMISKKNKDVKYKYRKLKDSIEIEDKRMDTIFKFSDFQKAKRVNGNIVISKKDSIYWNIRLFIFDKNNLITQELYSDFDLKKMDSITKVKAKMMDSTTYIITPSKSEFKKFLKLKDFGYERKYKKVK